MLMTIKSMRLFFLVAIVAGGMLYQSSAAAQVYDPATALFHLRKF